MKLAAEGRCGRGRIRKDNQDHIFVNGKWRGADSEYRCADLAEKGIYAVCDGMGGEQWGEEAARIAVLCLKQAADEKRSVEDCLLEANRNMCECMQKRDYVRMGSTAVVFSVSNGIGKVYNIGDSRAYLCQPGMFRQISHDHNQAQQMVDMGILSREQAKMHPARHRLTQHLGIFPSEFTISPFVSDDITLGAGTMILLCSDGLTGMLVDQEICTFLQKSCSLAQKADMLFEAAMERGGKDNISLILLECQ